ncbi:tyrosine-type recombinase/integrase [Candidatus Nitrotoga sp. M5]|uniref:tyrosine-type recombinase/integrase n=1 Tax=Candidatus Nitrotoga sp. M5 TaxID=2890409 RepID=UPI001EF50355|nr:integrase arm-type DNA-binding domain-containing protein [Candidatus Nitrotoga sp. M5]CAH1387981.1 Tyr recombinase domain-containing protein [Candidatus Nitrotoga sp. M5]
MALTDRQIQSGKTAGPDLFLNDGKGLYLRIRPSGRKNWLYRYKDPDKKTQWLDLGAYPSCSLNDARLKTAELKIQRISGIDPVEEKHKNIERIEIEKAVEKAASRTRLTVLELFNSWEKRELADRHDKGAEVRRSFQKDVFPTLGLIPVKDIKRAMVVSVLDSVVERGARIIARNLLGDLRQMFGYAITREIMENDPTYRLKRDDFGKKTERERILTKAEIKSLPEKLRTAKLAKSSVASIWVMLSTCCRVGEISRAAWKDIDLDGGIWRIPPENAKNSKAHTIYLSHFAIQQFKELKILSGNSRWVLPGRLPDMHVCQKSLSKQIGDRQRGDKAPMKCRSLHTNALELPGGKWTSHDLRRTGATTMGILGVRPDVIEKCLNHVEQNKLVRIYQRQKLEVEQGEAWRLLGEQLEFQLTDINDNII